MKLKIEAFSIFMMFFKYSTKEPLNDSLLEQPVDKPLYYRRVTENLSEFSWN